MKYYKTVILNNGSECILRNGTEKDGKDALDVFVLTHGQTDYLLTYPDENSFSAEQEAEFLMKQTESENGIEIVAETGGKIVGLAGIDAVGTKYKTCRRAEFGISVDKDCWGLGVGRALTGACIECAVKAGYAQIELDVIAENERAISLYKSFGFTEYGRNPRGFLSRITGKWQELVLMRLELDSYAGKEGNIMKEPIAYCGLDCSKCDAFIATKNDDGALREKTAKLWTELNGVEITPEQINCEGCRMDGVKTVFCDSLCGIRQCALKRGVKTCGDCPEMESCATLSMITSNNKEALERLRNK